MESEKISKMDLICAGNKINQKWIYNCTISKIVNGDKKTEEKKDLSIDDVYKIKSEFEDLARNNKIPFRFEMQSSESSVHSVVGELEPEVKPKRRRIVIELPDVFEDFESFFSW